jgi:tetratricopeptide (TPR) repeat protein
LELPDHHLKITNHHGGGIVDRLLSEADKLYQMGRAQQAADILLQTIEQFPGDRRTYHAFAEILIEGNQFGDGLDTLRKISESDYDQRTRELAGYCLLGLGRLDDAQACAAKLLSDKPGSASGFNLMGRLALEKDDRGEAEAYFKQAINFKPDCGSAWVYLGIIQWDRGQAESALDLIEKGFIHDHADFKAATTYHAAVTELGAFERSESVFMAAVKHNPHNERLQNLLIDVLLKQQKYAVALNHIERALAVFGASDGILDAAEKIKAIAGQGRPEITTEKECILSVCMIVKNEAAHLAKCLRSVRPVADEIIIVDTGSSDRSKDIAGIFDAKIFDFEWVDDFAKAKNFAVSKACGEWVLSLDADEVISPLDYAALRSLVDNTPSRSTAYSIVTRNYINRVNAVGWSPNDGKYSDEEAGYGWIPSEKVRLFPNHADIRFEYPVHEMVEPALERLGIEIRSCHIPVHHYGKLDERNSATKGQRYYQIGIKKLAEMDHSIIALRELAIQAATLKEYGDAVSLWQKVIGKQPQRADAYVNLGTAYWNIGKYQEAVEAARKAMELASDMKEAPFNYCLSLLHLGGAKAAVPVLESLVAKYPEYLAARFLLAAALCCAGQSQEGMEVLERLKQSQLGSGLSISCHTLAQGLRSAGQMEYAQAILDAAIRTNNANEDVLALLNNCQDIP